jgi:hypothetical protein
LGELLALFSTDLNSALNFACYDTHIKFFKTKFVCLYMYEQFLQTLLPELDETAQKNEKRIL